jgi:NAD(P)-dependent dehydrogenase (short-subunit alcohol dehydrogenase family)
LPTLDLVILNAGSCEYVDDAMELDTALFQRMLDTNFTGTINSLVPLLQHLQPGSRLAIVSSMVTQLPLTRAAAYGASKAALDYLARSLRIDLDAHDIHLTLVRPGFIDTPLTRKNTFPMPGLVDVVSASRIVRRGLEKGRDEIRFPTLFAAAMELCSLLPANWWFRLAVKMRRAAR